MNTRYSERADKTYLSLVRKFPLRPIRSDRELDRAIEMVDSLIDREDLDAAEQDYLDVLGDLVHRYESQKHPMSPLPDGAMLQHLIEAKGVSQSAVALGAGIADSTISEVLRGKRNLSRGNIGKLARYFQIDPGVFAFEG